RRNPDWKDVQPVVQVRTELPLGDHLLEIAIGGGDQPKVDANGSRASHSLVFTVLKRAQQLRLQLEWHVADLVEEQRALMRQLEPADLLRQCPGERSKLVAGPLALEQPRGRVGAVHRHERPAPAVTGGVNRPCDELLARAGLAEQQYAGVGR